MKLKSCLAFSAILMLFSFCSQAQMTNDPTTWEYSLKKTAASTYEVIFKVKLESGWHIFSQKPGDEFLIPPSFTFDKIKGLRLVGKPKEVGKMKTETMVGVDNPINFYEHEVAFVQQVKATKGMKISGAHEYQVCNDKMCLPPKTKKISLVVKD